MNTVTVNLKELSTFDDWVSAAEKSVVKLNEDPFALAAASYRYWVEGKGRYRGFDTVEVQQQDRHRGNEMRCYYRGRLVFSQLRSTSPNPVSEFRQKLWGLCEGTIDLQQKDIGLLYRLPYFYAEDLAHDRIFLDLPSYTVIHTVAHDVTETFELQQQVLISRRSRDVHQYWLRTSATSVPCQISIAADNGLRPLLESVLHRGPVALRANWHPQYMRGYHRGRAYYQLGNPVLA